MTATVAVVVGLFLLAPGLATFAGVFHGSRLGPVHSPPPPQGSILTLAVVTLGALLAHLTGAAVFALQDVVCTRAIACIRTAFDPDPYALLFGMLRSQQAVDAPRLLMVLLALAALSAAAFAASDLAMRRLAGQAQVRATLYGWLADYAPAASGSEALLAYVISDIAEAGTVVGYEGIVANLAIDADKQITSILLEECEVFFLRVTSRGVIRRETAGPSWRPSLYVSSANVRNIAFEKVRIRGAS